VLFSIAGAQKARLPWTQCGEPVSGPTFPGAL
jgi:hypothetical protein